MAKLAMLGNFIIMTILYWTYVFSTTFVSQILVFMLFYLSYQVLLVSMSVMDCRSYSLSKAIPTPKGQDVGEPFTDSDQSILPSHRSGECNVCNSGLQFFIYRNQ